MGEVLRIQDRTADPHLTPVFLDDFPLLDRRLIPIRTVVIDTKRR